MHSETLHLLGMSGSLRKASVNSGLVRACESLLPEGMTMEYHLRQICVETEMIPMGKPEIMISRAFEKFDNQGSLTDESVRQHLRQALLAFRQWILRLRGEKLQTIRPYQLS